MWSGGGAAFVVLPPICAHAAYAGTYRSVSAWAGMCAHMCGSERVHVGEWARTCAGVCAHMCGSERAHVREWVRTCAGVSAHICGSVGRCVQECKLTCAAVCATKNRGKTKTTYPTSRQCGLALVVSQWLANHSFFGYFAINRWINIMLFKVE